MQTSPAADRARQYLLGALSDDDQAAVEREYLASQEALDRIGAAEDLLIEEYLDDALDREERTAFERTYLQSPVRRRRIDTVRRLRAAASGGRQRPAAFAASSRRTPRVLYAALATAAVILVLAGLGAWWAARIRTANPSQSAGAASTPHPGPSSPASAPPAPAAAPRVVAFALSPIATRSDTSSEPLIVPPGTDAVALDLEVQRPLPSARAVVATVGGNRSWTGSAVPLSARPAVRVDVPAAQLPPDDYIVTLYAREGGVESEQYRYFLRVRER